MTKLSDWFARIRSKPTRKKERGPLREFVYLDDVSVHSILASRIGGIATQFTENKEASLTSNVGRSVGIGLDATKANIDTKSQTVDAKTSSVLSKAVIQTSFKELYEIERDSLALRTVDDSTEPQNVESSRLAHLLKTEQNEPWFFDPASFRRGDLIEVQIALEADPIFHIVSVFSTVIDLFQNNENLLGNDIADQLPQVASLVQVLNGLLAGLVPIRGRLVDYKYATISDQDVLIHHKILDRMQTDELPKLRPVYVVGVAERDLFWKDIRQVLFSGGTYTSFCRVATDGIAKTWHPIKVANVLSGIVPNFDELVVDLGEMARTAITGANFSANSDLHNAQHLGFEVALRYAEFLAEHHGRALPPQNTDTIRQAIPATDDWLTNVDRRRSVFANITRAIEGALKVKTGADGEIRFRARRHAMNEARFVGTLTTEAQTVAPRKKRQPTDNDDVFLDAEVIAIYW